MSRAIANTPPMGVRLHLHLESDAELRARLVYVAGDSTEMIKRVMTASSHQLDDLAEEVGIVRRGT